MGNFLAAVIALSNLANAVSLLVSTGEAILMFSLRYAGQSEPEPLSAEEQIKANTLIADRYRALKGVIEADAGVVALVTKEA